MSALVVFAAELATCNCASKWGGCIKLPSAHKPSYGFGALTCHSLPNSLPRRQICKAVCGSVQHLKLMHSMWLCPVWLHERNVPATCSASSSTAAEVNLQAENVHSKVDSGRKLTNCTASTKACGVVMDGEARGAHT